MNSILVGYVRKSNAGGAIKVNISEEAFNKANRYLSKEGEEFVNLVINLDHLKQVIDGEKEVTSISQISDSPVPPEDNHNEVKGGFQIRSYEDGVVAGFPKNWTRKEAAKDFVSVHFENVKPEDFIIFGNEILIQNSGKTEAIAIFEGVA